ncbi:MAG: hypothetical protein AAF412_04165 [Pseudomonadota bacterium]
MKPTIEVRDDGREKVGTFINRIRKLANDEGCVVKGTFALETLTATPGISFEAVMHQWHAKQ